SQLELSHLATGPADKRQCNPSALAASAPDQGNVHSPWELVVLLHTPRGGEFSPKGLDVSCGDRLAQARERLVCPDAGLLLFPGVGLLCCPVLLGNLLERNSRRQHAEYLAGHVALAAVAIRHREQDGRGDEPAQDDPRGPEQNEEVPPAA